MGSRVGAASVTRCRAPEVHRGACGNITLQKEANSVRERRLALEQVMRQERARRLQAAAGRRMAAAKTNHTCGSADMLREQQQSEAANSNPTPQTLEEYRRELDKDNGNYGHLRLHYYTGRHLNPADVHFYAVKSRVKKYQRHASSLPSSARAHFLMSPTRKGKLEAESRQPSTRAVEAIPVKEDTSEQWTKAARLRMQANQQVLRRIEERERREAARIGQLSAPPQPYKAPVMAREMTRDFLHCTEDALSTCDTPRSLAVDRDYTVRAPTWRWSPLRQRSPLKTYLNTSPVSLRGRAASPPTFQSNFLLKPPLIYGSSAPLQASRTVNCPPPSAAYKERAACPRKSLQYSDAARHTDQLSRSTYKPIVEQLPSTAWESHSTWAYLMQSRSHATRGAPARFLPTRDFGISEASEGTPSMPNGSSPTPNLQPTLPDGFSMSGTVLKREDLFRGFI
ncbi:hypothetical protein, conserved [Leishmania tarentolae]|uniref:Uncharacterized protein n=1 Tax=Leishmania tarentolae TaxID=5689 RepID=A0A640KTM7_LEITA|nr:hypothetical protein, conserved [Leishmania tarentolae]